MPLKGRSNYPEVFYTKGVLKNFAKFTGKLMCCSFVFNKVTDLKLVALLKKRF